MLDRALALAQRKGYTLRAASAPDAYQLIDNFSHLPQLNEKTETLFFTLAEAIELLERVPDRQPRR